MLELTSVRQGAGATSRREEILSAAGTLFAESGYHGTSVRDIAGAVGMQAASLYAHVQRKEDLLHLIVDRAADEFVAAIAPIAADHGRPVAARLRAALCAHLDVVARNLPTSTVFFHDWRALPPARRDGILGKRDRYEGMWRDLVAEGVASGELRACDARFAAIAWLSAANWFHAWYSPAGALTPAAIADRIADLLLEGLVSR